MQIEIRIDPACTEPRIIVHTDQMTEEVSELLKRLAVQHNHILAGFADDRVSILDPDAILRIYACGQKVFAVTQREQYVLRLRLYEVEERVSPLGFARISNSEIINLKKALGFDLSLTGTICVKLCDGTASYVSRRYVGKIKDLLGI